MYVVNARLSDLEKVNSITLYEIMLTISSYMV